MEDNRENCLAVKYLRGLFCIAVVSLVNSFLVSTFIAVWISRGIMAAMVYCMIRMAALNPRYRKSGVLRGIMFACTLITSFVYSSTFLALVVSLLSVFAVYQEYRGHSELIAEMDVSLSEKWHKLFIWSIGASVLVSVGSIVTVMMLMMTDSALDVSGISGAVTVALGIPRFFVELTYLRYIYKMMSIFTEREAR